MIDYMVFALPRSGTGWASNWLMAGSDVPSLHEGLTTWDFGYLDAMATKVGLVDTTLFCRPDARDYLCRKGTIHRPLDAINRSLDALGLPRMTKQDEHALLSVGGRILSYEDMFDIKDNRAAGDWYEFITGQQFDEFRHSLLVGLNVQISHERFRSMLIHYRDMAIKGGKVCLQ